MKYQIEKVWVIVWITEQAEYDDVNELLKENRLTKEQIAEDVLR